MSFKQIDLSDSARDFKEIVWPNIKEWFGEGELIPVEAVTESNMARKLDMYSGIDAWYIQPSEGIRGISCRVQWGPKAWQSFTIRKKRDSGARTEYEKLCNAINNDWLYPYWFSQSYLTERKGKLLSSGLGKTKDLIEYIQKYRPDPIPGPNAWFYPIFWDEFKKYYQLKELGD